MCFDGEENFENEGVESYLDVVSGNMEKYVDLFIVFIYIEW